MIVEGAERLTGSRYSQVRPVNGCLDDSPQVAQGDTQERSPGPPPLLGSDPNDEFRPLFSHYKVTGHACDVTDMSAGGYRCECLCGWWRDIPALDDARKHALVHIKLARLEVKRVKQRDRRVRENQRRIEAGRTPWLTA